MKSRQTNLRPAEAARLLKAAKAAGFETARLIDHPDGRREFVAENTQSSSSNEPLSPFKQWEANNEDKD
jgi:hypothetical protein